jgi:hypothetical protein
MPCKGCGELVSVTEYQEIAEEPKAAWWVGDAVELACPHCGDTFWVKK